MGTCFSAPAPPPPRNPVPAGKTRICVSGFTVCPPAGRSRRIAGNDVHRRRRRYVTRTPYISRPLLCADTRMQTRIKYARITLPTRWLPSRARTCSRTQQRVRRQDCGEVQRQVRDVVLLHQGLGLLYARARTPFFVAYTRLPAPSRGARGVFCWCMLHVAALPAPSLRTESHGSTWHRWLDC